jgi:hypothetical protein
MYCQWVPGISAVVVYRKLGLRILGTMTMWINLDLVWGGALVVTARWLADTSRDP